MPDEQESLAALVGDGKKSIVFQSRFRNFKQILGLMKNGRDRTGAETTTEVKVQFHNFLAVVPNDEDHVEIIASMRKRAGHDFIEVDLAKQNKDQTEKDAQIAALEKELAALRKAAKSPDVRVKKGGVIPA